MAHLIDASHNEVDTKQLIAYLWERLEHEVKLRKYTEGKLLEAQQMIVNLAARRGK